MSGNSDETVSNGKLLETSPFAGDLESELVARPRRHFSTLTVVLAAGVMLVAGVIVGIQAQKAMGGPDATAGAAMRQGAAAAGGGGGFGGRQQAGQGAQGAQGAQGQGARQGGQGGFAGRQGGFGGMTIGTIQKVDGEKVYVQTTDGSVVTVNTSDKTSVRVAKEGKVADLKPGGTVTVQGAKAEDGSVTATVINQGGGRR
ncbi:hypothetical protein [Streptosporangium lutulentum]|uniref:DUF5666 domain-containing protein n=1 Tax=Streptosporangium lutulentum TaxID=1461250 RepID=A0ABT9QP25_9ACTN|nr:hypothetical protein [Streptosporangium lutulentum]MDP9848522.1 hypothetical protein [Streptosporangium lutulentum]